MYVHSLTISVSQMTSSCATSLGNFSFRFHLPYIAPLPLFLLRPAAFHTSLPAYLDWDGRPVVCCLSFWVFFSGWNLMSSSPPPPRPSPLCLLPALCTDHICARLLLLLSGVSDVLSAFDAGGSLSLFAFFVFLLVWLLCFVVLHDAPASLRL